MNNSSNINYQEKILSQNIEEIVYSNIKNLSKKIAECQNIIKNSIASNTSQFKSNLTNNNTSNHIAVAVSGGADSLALTLILNKFAHINNYQLTAITVNHQIRDNSTLETIHLGNILAEKQIKHQVIALDKNILPKSNIEEKLRELRYRAISNYCEQNNIDLVFLGHQQDDLAENFLIRLFRGSGIEGLSAIEEVKILYNITLVRPMLNISKKQIINYLEQEKTQHIEDESNTDLKFRRNQIRMFINSLTDAEQVKARISQTAKFVSKIKDRQDRDFINKINFSLNFNPEEKEFNFSYQSFIALDSEIATKLLKEILIILSSNTHQPRQQKLQNLYLAIIEPNFKNTSLSHCKILLKNNILSISINNIVKSTTTLHNKALVNIKLNKSIIFCKISIE